MTTHQLTIKGHVQGVGFRNYVEQSADRADIKGEVWNGKDGNVYAIIQHQDESQLRAFAELLWKGPGGVNSVESKSIEKDPYGGFHFSATR